MNTQSGFQFIVEAFRGAVSLEVYDKISLDDKLIRLTPDEAHELALLLEEHARTARGLAVSILEDGDDELYPGELHH